MLIGLIIGVAIGLLKLAIYPETANLFSSLFGITIAGIAVIFVILNGLGKTIFSKDESINLGGMSAGYFLVTFSLGPFL